MRKYLRHDPDTGELRLVYDDYWQGNHERTEYRVIDRDDGGPLRGKPQHDGKQVFGVCPDLYVKDVHMRPVSFATEPVAIGPTVKTPCPRATNARRRCAMCAELAA